MVEMSEADQIEFECCGDPGCRCDTCPEQIRAFLHRCENQIYHEGIDLDDDARLRLFRLSGHQGEPPNYRAAWPPYAGMIEDARKALKA